jgi:hypothetical protein
MPEAWSNKDERQYEHIKESATKEGRSAKTAKRIAAATVNKGRAKEGRTKTKGAAKKSSGGAKKKSSSARGKGAGGSSTRAKKAAAGRKGGKAKARKSS